MVSEHFLPITQYSSTDIHNIGKSITVKPNDSILTRIKHLGISNYRGTRGGNQVRRFWDRNQGVKTNNLQVLPEPIPTLITVPGNDISCKQHKVSVSKQTCVNQNNLIDLIQYTKSHQTYDSYQHNQSDYTIPVILMVRQPNLNTDKKSNCRSVNNIYQVPLKIPNNST